MKPDYQYIFDLLDFAESLLERIDVSLLNGDARNYFMTATYVEDILDKYGRGMVRQSAEDSGLNGSEHLHLATARMENLRRQLRILAQKGDFDEVLESRGNELYQNWHKLPPDHPNLQSLQDEVSA